MQKQYADDNFVIIGEIGSCTRPIISGDTLLKEAGIVIPIAPRGSLRRPFEWIAGYITVGDNIYVLLLEVCFQFRSIGRMIDCRIRIMSAASVSNTDWRFMKSKNILHDKINKRRIKKVDWLFRKE